MTDSTIKRWLRAMNPIATPRGMAEAQRSARGLAFGLGLAWLASLPATVWMFQSDTFETLMQEQYVSMGLSASEIAMQEAVMGSVMPFALIFGFVFSIALYIGLAIAQWRYMTRFIPMILLAFFLFGVVSRIGTAVLGGVPQVELPMWALLSTWIPATIAAVIYAAALQGGIMLHRMKGG